MDNKKKQMERLNYYRVMMSLAAKNKKLQDKKTSDKTSG